MKITLFPSSVSGIITIPPSKSITHRAIICASLAKNATTIINPLISEETMLTIEAMRKLGVKIEYIEEGNKLLINPPKSFTLCNDIIKCGNSLRLVNLLIPIFVNIQQFGTFAIDKQIQQLLSYETIEKMNCSIIKTNNTINVLPSKIPDDLEIENTCFLNGLLLSSMFKTTVTKIIVKKSDFSASHKLTLDIMKIFNISIDLLTYEIDKKYYLIVINPNQYESPTSYTVEGDYETGANLIIAGLLGKRIIIKNLFRNSIQPESKIVGLLKKHDAKIDVGDDLLTINHSEILPFEADLNECPSLAPLLLALASITQGTSKLYNYDLACPIKDNKLSETIDILSNLGADIIVQKDFIAVTGANSLNGGVEINCYQNYHYLFMLFAINTYLNKPISIIGAECSKQSYPNFLSDMHMLGVNFTTSDE